jgi:osmotically-inducible protein OsmY
MTRIASTANVTTAAKAIGALLIACAGVACSATHAQQVSVTPAEDVASNPGVTISETLAVEVALTADRRVDASHIRIDSDHATRTVFLKGTVRTIDQKALAGQIAVARAAGYQVRNELRIGR